MDEPVATYLVVRAKPRAFRVATRGIEGIETRMIGRDAELEQLQGAVHSVCSSGTLAVVTVVADAGMGKSRLLYEFQNWAETCPEPLKLFQGRADPQTQSQPYGLLRDILAWRLQIADSDSMDIAKDKIERGIAPLFKADNADDMAQAHAHLLGHLVGLDFTESKHVKGILDDAKQIRNRGFHAAAQMFRHVAVSDGMPIVLLLDDLHWADEGSLDFLTYLTQVNRDVPMLVLALTRPTLFERRADWGGNKGNHQRIDLVPLDKGFSGLLAYELLKKLPEIPVTLSELIIDRADGNPFYMEELIKMLVDQGAIETHDDRWILNPAKLVATRVPQSLTGVLQARLDALAPTEKLALQEASVVGWVFWDQALAAIDVDAPAALADLAQHELVALRDSSAFDGAREYVFRHHILHQVTYDSLLKRQRREFHARVANWLAHYSGDRQGEALGPTAEHYERAGDQARACSFYAHAAENAAARYANEAMLDYVKRALALMAPSDHATHWRLLAVRERYLRNQEDRAAHASDLSAMESLAEILNDDACRAEVAYRRANAFNSLGDHAASERAARQGLVLAAAIDNASIAVPLRKLLSTALIGQGQYVQARQVAEDGLAIARTRGDRSGESAMLNVVGLIAMERGDLTLAAELFERCLVVERETGNLAGEGLLLNNLGSVYPRLGDYAKARQHLDYGLRLARATGLRGTKAILLVNMASVAHLQGDDASALAYADEAFDDAVAIALPDVQAFARLVAGHAELGMGQMDAARAAYEQSLALLEPLDMRAQQALDPVSGLVRVALAQGRLDEALTHTETILAHLGAGGSLDGTEEPLLIPLTCYRALSAVNDPRAIGVIGDAHAALQAQASLIGDLNARHGFLSHVPHHREILAAWSAKQGAPAGHD